MAAFFFVYNNMHASEGFLCFLWGFFFLIACMHSEREDTQPRIKVIFFEISVIDIRGFDCDVI